MALSTIFFNQGVYVSSQPNKCDINVAIKPKIVVSESNKKIYVVQGNAICVEARAYLPKCKNKDGKECKPWDNFGAFYPLAYGTHTILATHNNLGKKLGDSFYEGPAFDFKRLKGQFIASIHGVASSELRDDDSHGCIRISSGTARNIDDWVGIGNTVEIISGSYKNTNSTNNR